MPKEVPTMNLFCKVSWSSWYNARRMVETIFDVQKNIEDFSYSLIALYGGVIIILMIVDYFGSFWEKNLLFDNQVLTYALGIDVIIITINITVNLIKGCDINYLFEIE